MTTKDDDIEEFAAAALVQMSPELLQSFTKSSPKTGESKKLPMKKVGKHLTYSRKELLEFDEYLRKPWPSDDGKRPHIPKAIKDEVKRESFLQCAVCNSHQDTCEIAHIEPVATGKCNHPHNLINLCANHHTKFDKKGVLGPAEDVREYVAGFKQTLLYATRVKWGSHANSIAECFAFAQLCQRLKKEIEAIGAKATKGQLDSYNQLAGDAVARLKASALKGRQKRGNQKDTSTPGELWKRLELSVQSPSLSVQLASAAALADDEEFRAAAGFVDCPLCGGRGTHGASDCPVCYGEQQVDSAWADNIDLEPYTLVDCPLCKGEGLYEGEYCPVCHGDRKMERRFADRVDLADFDEVDCPLCKGKGQWKGGDCPECRGDCKMPKHMADRVDVSAHEEVECPVCDGDGQWGNNDCTACRGECKMPRHIADRIDLGEYDWVDCPLCKGKGRWRSEECLACQGECQMPRGDADRIELRRYDDVDCPSCNGSGQIDYSDEYSGDCGTCEGNGTVLRYRAEELD